MVHETSPWTSDESATLRKKLEYLMVVRVLMVTLLLGSAIVVNINDVNSFANAGYLGIAILIVATYIATIVYAVLIPRLQSVVGLAYVQVIGDVFLAAGLIGLTGGEGSIFAFLLYLTIINTAIVLGQRGAFIVASLCSFIFVAILLQALGVWGFEPSPRSLASRGNTSNVVYGAFVNIFACYVIALLAGHLARRLEERDEEIARKTVDIAQLQALNQNILSSISPGVLTLDQEHHVLLLNRSGEELLQCTNEDLFGTVATTSLPQLQAAIESLLSIPRELHDNDLVHWKGWIAREGHKARYAEVSHSLLTDRDGHAYGHIFVIKDLTAMRRLQRRIQRQDRMAVVGKLAAAIAHEIRNPLASISGSIEVMSVFSDPDPDQERLMKIVIREVDRLNDLIENFLDYARPQAKHDRDPVNLSDLILDVLDLFRQDSSLVHDVVFQTDLDLAKESPVQGNPQALRQVFWNLLRNAAQAIEGPGKITVQARPMILVRFPDGSSETTELQREGQRPDVLVVSISDTGKGIPEHLIDQIFEPFFTTKTNGTGLGLATINRIVEDHEGWINVTSQPNQGSTFALTLPCYNEEAQRDMMSLELASISMDESEEFEEPPPNEAFEEIPMSSAEAQQPFQWK